MQKPELTIPPLTEGQSATLTCTAPGLCSGSDPVFSWKWTGPGKDDFPITGNMSIEMPTPATWIHTSSVTFQATPSQHLTNVTCKVSFRNNITTQETVTLNINCEYFPSSETISDKHFSQVNLSFQN